VAQIHARLLDKIGTTQDLVAYIESDAGSKFLETANGAATPTPSMKILDAIRVGIVLAFAGAAELILRASNASPDGAEFLNVSGGILLAIGLGFLVSAFASYTLSKSWGLLPIRN
jgi:hypothetical protein